MTLLHMPVYETFTVHCTMQHIARDHCAAAELNFVIRADMVA